MQNQTALRQCSSRILGYFQRCFRYTGYNGVARLWSDRQKQLKRQHRFFFLLGGFFTILAIFLKVKEDGSAKVAAAILAVFFDDMLSTKGVLKVVEKNCSRSFVNNRNELAKKNFSDHLVSAGSSHCKRSHDSLYNNMHDVLSRRFHWQFLFTITAIIYYVSMVGFEIYNTDYFNQFFYYLKSTQHISDDKPMPKFYFSAMSNYVDGLWVLGISAVCGILFPNPGCMFRGALFVLVLSIGAYISYCSPLAGDENGLQFGQFHLYRKIVRNEVLAKLPGPVEVNAHWHHLTYHLPPIILYMLPNTLQCFSFLVKRRSKALFALNLANLLSTTAIVVYTLSLPVFSIVTPDSADTVGIIATVLMFTLRFLLGYQLDKVSQIPQWEVNLPYGEYNADQEYTAEAIDTRPGSGFRRV